MTVQPNLSKETTNGIGRRGEMQSKIKRLDPDLLVSNGKWSRTRGGLQVKFDCI